MHPTLSRFAKPRRQRLHAGTRPPASISGLIALMITIYCLGIFAALDFIYSSFLPDEGRSPRIAHPRYHHGLAANYDGYDAWGDVRYRLLTNSLGLRDAMVREVPLEPAMRRVILIGDSFTEGIGVDFPITFAGRLSAAGRATARRTEFLNAAVISYSPTLYYQKIKYLLDVGVRFDEVVALPDESDIRDEASSYFCHDDDPSYRKYCSAQQLYYGGSAPLGWSGYLSRHFTVSDKLRTLVKFKLQAYLGNRKKLLLAPTSETGWLFAEWTDESEYAPLGIEGGLRRALHNMQALADLLKAHRIPLSVAVYPWPVQLARDDHQSRQVTLWRDFCVENCQSFIDLFPAFFAASQHHDDWYERLFIPGDFHFSAAGHEVMFRALASALL